MTTITVWIMIIGYMGIGGAPIAIVDNIANEEECVKLKDALKYPLRGTCLPVVKAHT